jgi:hypothetical protein
MDVPVGTVGFSVNLFFYLPTENSREATPERVPTPKERDASTEEKPTLILTIPLPTCHKFSRKPLKWLQFLGYTLYGREGNIHTKTDDGSEQPVDYETSVLEPRNHDYYFRSPDK